jgi:hypothetical protein
VDWIQLAQPRAVVSKVRGASAKGQLIGWVGGCEDILGKSTEIYTSQISELCRSTSCIYKILVNIAFLMFVI